jgi:hypothetical protein
VKDLYGNVSDTLYRTVFVVLNQTGPTLTLTGASNVYVEVYNKYTEPGYQAKDNQGNDVTSSVVVTSNLDTSKIGTYSNEYVIVDAFGLIAKDRRAVTVGDSTRPVVSPKSNPYIQQVGTAIDLTKVVTVTDNYWPSSFVNLNIQGTVDVNNVGSYFIRYVAQDNSGNIGDEVLVEVIVKDTKAPTITLKGVSPMTWEVKTTFVDPWVNASDNYWPAGTVVITKKGTVNPNVLGEYTIWYIATDPSGNKDSISRVVKVVDTTIPYVDLLNINEVNLPRWAVYVDAPVSLVDNYNTDSEMRPLLVATNSLPLNAEGKPFGDAPGLYSIHYVVKDLSDNQSEEAIRTINVLKEPTPTGVNEVMNIEQLMSIYPNPSNGFVNMRLASVQKEDVRIVVLDMLGKELLETVIKNNNLQVQELDLTQHPKGFYLMKIQTGDQVYMKKIQIN